MPDSSALSDTLLQQHPACHWTVNSTGIFEQIYGDPSGIFGQTEAELIGHAAPANWTGRFSRAIAGESQSFQERRGDTLWHVMLFPIRTADHLRFAGGMAHPIPPGEDMERQVHAAIGSCVRRREHERNLLSRFLHDSVGQNLTALGLQLDLVRMDLEPTSPTPLPRIAEIQGILERMMEEVREYIYATNPLIAERTGLRAALEHLAHRLRLQFSGTVSLNFDLEHPLHPKVATAFYQIAEEATDNAIKHSGCSTIEITVKYTRTGTFQEVRDNGKGFESENLPEGFRGVGLMSMEHYARGAGLELAVVSFIDGGTVVLAELKESV